MIVNKHTVALQEKLVGIQYEKTRKAVIDVIKNEPDPRLKKRYINIFNEGVPLSQEELKYVNSK